MRPHVTESTAFGAACLAGLGIGAYRSLAQIATLGRADTGFEPSIDAARRDTEIAGWRGALSRVRSPAG